MAEEVLRKGKYEKIKRNLIIAAVVIILLGLYYYIALPAVNIHSTEFWIFLGVLVLLAAALFVKKKKLSRYELKESKGLKVIMGIFCSGCHRISGGRASVIPHC